MVRPKFTGPQRTDFGSGLRNGHYLLPEVLQIGKARFDSADHGYLSPHTHEGAYEFCLILSGEVEWETHDSSTVLRPGDVFITRPGELHWGRDSSMHPCEFLWIIIGCPAEGYCWRGMASECIDHIESQLRNLRHHHLRAPAELRSAFERVFSEHEREVADYPAFILRREGARAALHALLVELLRALTAVETCRPDRSVESDDLAQTNNLENLATFSSVKQYCLHMGLDYRSANSSFIKRYGTTMHQYWVRERVRLARHQLVTTDQKIIDIATEFGFSSSQHFATMFRKITGLTPSEARRSRH